MNWPDLKTALRYYEAEGFTVGKVFCPDCRYVQVSALHDASASGRLECSRCGRGNGRLLLGKNQQSE